MKMRRMRGSRMAAALAVSLAALLPARGDVTYYLSFDPNSSPEARQVADSVAEAAAIYNTYGSFNKHWWVSYNPGIPTAEASYDGYMGYGGQRNTRAALHEGGHTMGVGQHGNYWANMIGGVWQGPVGRETAIAMGSQYADGLHGDSVHIWPWGLNFDSEDSYINRIKLIRILAAIRCDMGIMAFSREAENEVAYTGATAEFHVESPVATSYQWYRNGSPLSDGGDISGATTDTLRIANAQAADEGSYHCAATGAGETLNSRARLLIVEPIQQVGQWDMDGTVTDSLNGNNGSAYGSPVYVSGQIGQAIDLDGVDDYMDLPDAVGYTKDLTVATWVNWDGGSNWQRVFDFGTGLYQYMFLTPKSGAGTMQLLFQDEKTGAAAAQLIETAALPTGQWVHLAAVLNGEYATLYVNGQAVGSTAVPVTDLVDFLPTRNYIGKSQFADPLFDGRIDDFQVYNYALDGAEVWYLWGQSANIPPVFNSETMMLADAELAASYTGQSVAGDVTNMDLDPLTFEKADGPAWLSVSPNGDLSGNPGSADLGDNVFHVRVTDPAGASSDTEVRITVTYPSTWSRLTGTVIGTLGSWGGNASLTRDAVFDGDFGTYYDAVNATGDWAGLDLGSAAQISMIKYAPRAGFASRMVGGRFQGSNTADFSSGVVTLYTIGSAPVEAALTEQVIADPNTYRYVRYIGPEGGYCNVAEVEFYSPGESSFDGDPVLTGTSIGTAGSYGNNPDLTRDAALDGDLASYYDAVNATGDWVGLDLGQDQVITEISYVPRSGFALRMVGGVFEASNTSDFSSGVVTLCTVSSSPADAIYTTVPVSDPAAYRYVRYVGPANGYCNVAEIVFQGGGDTPPPDTTAPAAPSGLGATAGDGSVSLDWTNNAESDLDSYTVYRSTVSGSSYSVLASGLSSSAYTDSTAVNGTTYYYVVTAMDTSANQSTASSEVSATPQQAVAQQYVHVDAIALNVIAAGGPNRYGEASVTIVDASGQPVSGMTVSGSFSGSYSETGSAVTDASGVAVIQTANKTRNPSFTFTVTGVSGPDSTYDAGSNAVTSSSY